MKDPLTILKQLKSIRMQIDKIIKEYERDFPIYKNRIRCKDCGAYNIRMRKDKTYFCRTCGYDSGGKL